MKYPLVFLLILSLLGCEDRRRENNLYDKVMIFSSDTTYVNDISWEMDDLLKLFYQDSLKFSIDSAKKMNADRLLLILQDLDRLKENQYAKKNPFIREFNFCKKWQIILLKQGVQKCAICIDTNAMLMSVKDTVFMINRAEFNRNESLRDLYPKKEVFDVNHFSSRTINILNDRRK